MQQSAQFHLKILLNFLNPSLEESSNLPGKYPTLPTIAICQIVDVKIEREVEGQNSLYSRKITLAQNMFCHFNALYPSTSLLLGMWLTGHILPPDKEKGANCATQSRGNIWELQKNLPNILNNSISSYK